MLGVLTGHVLKDPDATINYHADALPGIKPNLRNAILQADDDIERIVALLDSADEYGEM